MQPVTNFIQQETNPQFRKANKNIWKRAAENAILTDTRIRSVSALQHW